MKLIEKITQRLERALNLDNRRFVKAYNRLLKTSNNIGITSEPYSDKELIVSLTTYGKRIGSAHMAIESLLQQTMKPNRIILWLSKDEFNDDRLPDAIKSQQDRGLEVRYCDDYKSYKKLLPTLLANPDATVITFDDDIIYPADVIEQLYDTHLQYPEDIICTRCHKITFAPDGNINPYTTWEWETATPVADNKIFPTGGAGCLYPAGCFHKDVTDYEKIRHLCPHADDVWFKFMTLLNNRNCRRSYKYDNFKKTFYCFISSGDMLMNYNLEQNGNDIQIINMLEAYPEVMPLLKKQD